MAKKIQQIVKLQIPGGQATPAPPVGPALGQTGINMPEFCKQFNAKTKDQMGELTRVEVTVYADRSFSYVTKTPPASYLIKKAARVDKASGEPNRVKVGRITSKQVREIALVKQQDMTGASLEACESMVRGTARAAGIEVVD
jgi:large subunit ribosomal protein L11